MTTTETTAAVLLDEATRAKLDAAVAEYIKRRTPIDNAERRRENRRDRKKYLQAVKAEVARLTPKLHAILRSAYPDTWERVQAGAEYVRPISQALGAVRDDRDMAGVQIWLAGEPPVVAYRAIGVNRSMFIRIRARYERRADQGKVSPPAFADPFKTGAEAATQTARLIPYMDGVRKLRDLLILEATDAVPDVSSAELGRMFDVTGQLVTILRTSGGGK